MWTQSHLPASVWGHGSPGVWATRPSGGSFSFPPPRCGLKREIHARRVSFITVQQISEEEFSLLRMARVMLLEQTKALESKLRRGRGELEKGKCMYERRFFSKIEQHSDPGSYGTRRNAPRNDAAVPRPVQSLGKTLLRQYKQLIAALKPARHRCPGPARVC